MVGDLALHLVGAGVSPADLAAEPDKFDKFDLPDSVVGFLRGELVEPPGGWPEPFRTRALKGRRAATADPELSAEDETALADNPRDTLNRLLFTAWTRAASTRWTWNPECGY